MNTLSAIKNPAIAYANTSPIIAYHVNPIRYIHRCRGDAPVLAPFSPPCSPRFRPRARPVFADYQQSPNTARIFQYGDKIAIANHFLLMAMKPMRYV